jgi:hypothetical protein
MKTEDIIINSGNFQDYTKVLCRKYAWELREIEENTLLPQVEYDKVMTQIEKAFKTEYFRFIGIYPTLIFANLLGLKKRIMTEDYDAVMYLVAPPGYGKSTNSFLCARFMDVTFDATRIIFNYKQFKTFLNDASKVYHKITTAQKEGKTVENPMKGKVYVVDEGVYMFYSGDSSSKQGKDLQKLFSVIRALNLILIVNSTNFRRISKGVKEDRVSALIKIPTKGYMYFYSKKKVSEIRIMDEYIKFPKHNFYDRSGFIDKSCEFWKDYLMMKSQFLVDVTEETTKGKGGKDE